MSKSEVSITFNPGAEKEADTEMCDKIVEIFGKHSSEDCCCEVCKRVDFDKCEDFKEVTLKVDLENCQTRLLRVNVELEHVCRDRFLAVSVILVKPGCNQIISQKGTIIYTGKFLLPCKHITKEFCFTLPGKLCEDPCPIDIKVVANYILTNPNGTLPCKDTDCEC